MLTESVSMPSRLLSTSYSVQSGEFRHQSSRVAPCCKVRYGLSVLPQQIQSRLYLVIVNSRLPGSLYPTRSEGPVHCCMAAWLHGILVPTS